MIGHPIARMETILRQGEAPVKIFNLQASQHRSLGPSGRIWLAKGPIGKTCTNFWFLKISLGFYIDPGGPGGHPGRSRTDPRA